MRGIATADRPLAFTLFPHAVYAIQVAALLAAILAWNGGFSYTLDDAYIHLALSERIWLAGTYGINAGEVSSPASSILWPALLAPPAGTGIHHYWPLILNIVLSFASIGVLGDIVDRVLDRPEAAAVATAPWLPAAQRAVAVACLVLACNLVGLTLGGMEHVLQIFLTLLVVRGVIDLTESERVSFGLLLAVVIGPLVRFENAAVSVAGIAVLAAHRRYGLTALALILVAAALGGFAWFLTAHGLDPLPSSVFEKIGLEGGFLMNRVQMYIDQRDYVMIHYALLALVVIAFAAFHRARSGIDGEAMVLLAMLLVLVAHVAFGRWGWLGRYELYVVAFVMPLSLYALRRPLATAAGRAAGQSIAYNAAALAMVAGIAAVAFATYLFNGVVRVPFAARSIFLQQYQMHRFAVDFLRRPVAVNDIGWVAFGNPSYVLDLWGLAARDARVARLSREPGWVERLARRHGVEVAMVYSGAQTLGPHLPAAWIRLGTLRSPVPFATAFQPDVDFFATDPSHLDRARAALAGFVPTLPRGAAFERAP